MCRQSALLVTSFLSIAIHGLFGPQTSAMSAAWLPARSGSWELFCRQHYPMLPLSPLFRWAKQKCLPSALKMQKSEGELKSLTVPLSSAFEKLKQWLINNGATLDLHSLQLKSCMQDGATSHQGLVSRRHYQQGDLIASIPAHLHFTCETIEQFARRIIGESLEACDTDHQVEPLAATLGSVRATDPKAWMAVLLAFFQEVVRAKGYASLSPVGNFLQPLYEGWLTYLRVLPQPSQTIPMFWKADELQALEHPIGHSVLIRLHRLRCCFPHFESLCRRHYSKLTTASRPPNSSDLFERLVSAYATVLSRSIKTPTGTNVFIPLADLCGHSPHGGNACLRTATRHSQREAPSEGRLNEAESVQLIAKEPILPGDDILVTYGAFDNATLLLNYGSLPLKNPHERTLIEFSPRRVHFALRSLGVKRIMLTDDFTFLGERVVRELSKLGLVPPMMGCLDAEQRKPVEHKPTVTIDPEANPDDRLLAAAKVITADVEDDISAQEELGPGDITLSKNADENATRFLISFLQHALFEQFSTTAAEDATLLRERKTFKAAALPGLMQETALTPAMEMAIRFRSGKREAIRAAIARLKQSIAAVRQN